MYTFGAQTCMFGAQTCIRLEYLKGNNFLLGAPNKKSLQGTPKIKSFESKNLKGLLYGYLLPATKWLCSQCANVRLKHMLQLEI